MQLNALNVLFLCITCIRSIGPCKYAFVYILNLFVPIVVLLGLRQLCFSKQKREEMEKKPKMKLLYWVAAKRYWRKVLNNGSVGLDEMEFFCFFSFSSEKKLRINKAQV